MYTGKYTTFNGSQLAKMKKKTKVDSFKGFSWGGYGFADRFMILTYLCPTIQAVIINSYLPTYELS